MRDLFTFSVIAAEDAAINVAYLLFFVGRLSIGFGWARAAGDYWRDKSHPKRKLLWFKWREGSVPFAVYCARLAFQVAVIPRRADKSNQSNEN